MGSLPDSKYIIQTDGYWFVEAHDVDPSKGYITVSAKGIVNGLSNQPNDGADFGPDTYNPNYSGSGIPYTQTSGIQEALTYAYNNGGNEIRCSNGIYDTTNAPYQTYTNNSGTAQAKILIGNGDGFSTEQFVNISIVGESAPNSGAEVVGTPVTTNGVVFRDLSSGSTTPSYIIGVKGSTSGLAYMTNIVLVVDNILTLVASGNGIGGMDLKSSSMLTVPNKLVFSVSEKWPFSQPTNSNQVAINISGEYNALNAVNAIYIQGGYYNGINIGHHPQINKINVTGCYNAFYIDNSIHEGHIASANIEYTQNIFNFASTYSTPSNTPLKISQMAIANNNNYDNGLAWMNPVSFMVIPSGVTIIWAVYIDLLSYYGGIIPSNYYPTTSNNLYIGIIQYSATNIPTSSYFTGNPTISTNPPVSGTAYQNTLPYDILIYLPVYTSTSGTAGNVKASIGPTSTPATQVVNDIVNSGTSSSNPRTIQLKVPAGWWYEFTGTTTTFGTATVVAD